MVRVCVYNRSGDLVGPVESPKWVLTDDEWRRRLSAEQFRILRKQGTERAFCGRLLDNKQEGVYVCAGCGLPLFASDSKFNSRTGWPSFFQPVAQENVVERPDPSQGMARTEILCARCDGHLGHVFKDGPRPTGLRFCLNSESLNFTSDDRLAMIADPAADAPAQPQAAPAEGDDEALGPTANAVLAGGCFWCTEAVFEQLEGVLDVESGYVGGSKESANYQRVCDGDTGHAEAIRITYDPKRITYDQLLTVFFDAHDPTQLDRQGNDIGSQYRSAIFYTSEKQKRTAGAKIASLVRSGQYSRPIVTSLEPLTEFFRAEDYHQDYARRNPNQPYIRSHSTPLACKVREKHAALIRKPS